jgi:hypothetical protein
VKAWLALAAATFRPASATGDANLKEEKMRMTYRLNPFALKLTRLTQRVSSVAVLALLCAAVLSAQVGKIPEGFTRLFNGKDLTGWHISRVNHHGTTGNWYVENGVLFGKQNPIGEGGLLVTDKKYKDFEFYVEINPDLACDGGIFLRSTEGGSAYQVNILANRRSLGGMGMLIGEKLRVSPGAKADAEKVWKRDDWNSMRVRMTGDPPRIILWINDEQMYDVTQTTNAQIGDATDGVIGLQVHWGASYMTNWRPNGAHRFRNMAIKEIK